MEKNKMNLICNKLTILEMFINQMITREDKMNKEQFKIYLKSVFDLSIKPRIQKIKEDGQKMEDGLRRRQAFLIEHELEEDYQKLKLLSKKLIQELTQKSQKKSDKAKKKILQNYKDEKWARNEELINGFIRGINE